MKIFSLETKKHLAGWSLVVGFILNLIVLKISSSADYMLARTSGLRESAVTIFYFGWPYRISFSSPYEASIMVLPAIIDLVFWVLISLIILSIIRHFKYRKV